jgi:hypothetical protein
MGDPRHADRWISKFERGRVRALAQLKKILKEKQDVS